MLNLGNIRAQFPALEQTIDGVSPVFFDSPGGSQVSQHVMSAMTAYLSHFPANLGVPTFNSRQTEATMAAARDAVAALLNAPSAENIVFGASATSLIFHLSRVISKEWQAGDEVIVSTLDHYANVSPWVLAAKEKGVIVHQLKINTRTYDLDYAHLQTLVNPKTRLIAVTHASNTVGSVVNVASVCGIAKSVGALSFIDAVHYAPHALLGVQALDCDFLVVSGYKFTGPHLAAIYGKTSHWERLIPEKVAPAANINPNRWEQGTQNFEAMAGLTASIHYLASLASSAQTSKLSLRAKLQSAFEKISAHEQALSTAFLNRLAEYPNITLYGKAEAIGRTPTFAFRIANRPPREFIEYAAKQHICIADGHFYAQGLCEQLGLFNQGGVIRAGCLHYHSLDDIERFFSVLQEYI